MGIAQYFSLFANMSVVQGVGASAILNGAVGSGTSVTLDSAFTVNGMRFASDATTLQVAKDLTVAMAYCSGRSNQIELTSFSLSNLVLLPGVYFRNSFMTMLDPMLPLTLDAAGYTNAVWIFNIIGDLHFNGVVKLINYPGSDVPVWWNVRGQQYNSVNIGFGAKVIGNIMSTLPIRINSGGVISTGSLLTLNSITFNQGSSLTSQAKTYPNSYGVIGEHICVVFVFVLWFIVLSLPHAAPVEMGIAQYFAVFGNISVVQGGGSSGKLNGAMGSGTSVTLDSAFTVHGRVFTSDATTLQVAEDLTAAMADCSGRANQIELNNTVDNLVLTPGVYHGESMVLNRGQTLTLDAVHNVKAVWIFNLVGSVSFSGNVTLINYPGSDVPVWWNLESHMHLASEAVVIGNIMSTSAIETPSNSTMSIGALLSLDSVTFSQGSNVTGQAWTYPNSYAGKIGERIIIFRDVTCCNLSYFTQLLSKWASLSTLQCSQTPVWCRAMAPLVR
jgi:hypothetical protein